MAPLKQSGRENLGVALAMLSLALLAVMGRFAAKVTTKTSLKLEDWLIACGFLTFVAYVALTLQAVYSSGGTLDESQMSLAQITNAFKYIYAAESFFTATITLVKISILALYRTIFPTSGFRKATVVIGTLCLLWFLICFFITVFECRPLHAAWEIGLQLSGQASCFNYGQFIVGYEVTNVLLDVCILCLPVWMIKRLQLPRAKKLVIGGIFLLGGFVCITCIIRVIYLSRAQTSDHPISLSLSRVWSMIELSMAIVCACLPCYGPFIPMERITNTVEKWSQSIQNRGNRGSPRGHGLIRSRPRAPTKDFQELTPTSPYDDGAGTEVAYPLAAFHV